MFVYLLSIVDSVDGILTMIGLVSALIATVSSGVYYLYAPKLNHKYDFEREEALEATTFANAFRKKSLILAVVCLLLSSFIPSRRGIMEAYIMAEAGKVATAENAKAAVDGALQRIDRLITAMEQKP